MCALDHAYRCIKGSVCIRICRWIFSSTHCGGLDPPSTTFITGRVQHTWKASGRPACSHPDGADLSSSSHSDCYTGDKILKQADSSGTGCWSQNTYHYVGKGKNHYFIGGIISSPILLSCCVKGCDLLCVYIIYSWWYRIVPPTSSTCPLPLQLGAVLMVAVLEERQ